MVLSLMANPDCKHGNDPGICDACAYQREKDCVVLQQERDLLAKRAKKLEKALKFERARYRQGAPIRAAEAKVLKGVLQLDKLAKGTTCTCKLSGKCSVCRLLKDTRALRKVYESAPY
jgi:hypothetical protein